jgi:Rod binding domain-containing protein
MGSGLTKVDAAATAGTFASAALPAAYAKGAKAARDFESILLTSAFDGLEKAFRLESDDSTPGASDYRLMATRALAEAVSANGGIGIAQLILRHLPVTKVPAES